MIERNARSQTQLIADLLDMSRIVSGKLRIERQPVDLAAVIRAAIESVAPSADTRSLHIDSRLAPPIPPIDGDAARLQQVVWNLLSNAVKFTPAGGRIHVALEASDAHARITVADTGSGIPAEFVGHIFERFRQADGGTTRKHGGLGLGLAIVKSIVEMHGGTVRASSDGPGTGSTFVVELPIAAATGHRSAPEADAGREATAGWVDERTLDGLVVLVVDDDADSRDLVRRMVEECGGRVLSAADAAEGFALLQSQRPDVLLSDIGMAGEDGYSLIRRVRALPPAAGGCTPAAALTAFARSEDRHRALMAGYQSHVVKPFDRAELVALVAGLAGRVAVLDR